METNKTETTPRVYVKPELNLWGYDPMDMFSLSGEGPDPTDPNQGIWIP